jgi:hypothetical protein
MAKEYIAVLGDVVGSRALAARPRARLQRRLREVLAEVNRRWRREIAARFAIALGDQFEGLLHTAAPLWELSHWVRAELPEVDWIVAAGRGPVSTPLARTATEVDGPCFHQARNALEAAKRRGQLLAVGGLDPAADGLADYYSALYWTWTARQRRTATLLRIMPPADAARRLGVDRSAVSHLATRMAWRLVSPADRAFRDIVSR